MKLGESQLTVIIPVYNVSQYVEECIASLLTQTCSDFRIVTINDGSTDDSWDKVVRMLHNDSRAMLISKTNDGLGETRNLGIRLAETEYITFLDSDDWWEDTYVEQMLAGTCNGEMDMVLADFYYVDDKADGKCVSKVSALRLPVGRVKTSTNNLISKARNFAWGKTYRRRLFTDSMAWFPPHAYEDVSVIPFLTASARKIYSIGKPLLYYRNARLGSIRSNLSTLCCVAQSVQELCERFNNCGLFERYYKDLRQLAWGQYVFVKRWAQAHNEHESVCGNIENVCFGLFPELKEFAKGKIYVAGGEGELLDALSRIVVDEGRFVKNEDEAKFVVRFAGKQDKKIYIEVSRPKDISAGETLAWNLAEDIMGRL